VTSIDPKHTSGESPSSGSDFGEARQLQLAQRKKKSDLGYAVSDTESDEAHFKRETSVHPEFDSDLPRRGKQGAQQKRKGKSKKQAGKARAQAESEAELIADQDDDEIGEDWPKVTGPLPQAAKDDALELARQVAVAAQDIARGCKKSVRDIMLAAGLAVRQTHPKNPMNAYRQWYAHMHPNDGCK